jgi:hemerythrin-like domain-containing protein
MAINSPTEILEAEHRVIAKVISAVSVLADRVEVDQAVDVEMLRNIVEFMRIYADKCHHGKEEDLLFPLLEKKGIPMQGCPVGALLAEHARGRVLVTSLSDATTSYENGEPAAQEAILKSLHSIFAVYPNHIWKEDYLLFPMTNKVLSPVEQQKLSEDFEEVETHIGKELHHRLEEVAEHLG